METLQRTKSDISSILLHTKETNNNNTSNDPSLLSLSALSEVELAKCECCGMSEECSSEYIGQVRKRYSGKLICGLCAEAVKEEMEKNGGKTREEALEEHMNVCVKFNKIGRAYPALYQADDVKKLLKRSSSIKKSSKGVATKKGGGGGGLARSSSCIPAMVKDMQDKLRV
ncbi:tRNA-guanine(15) transglycosylase [Bienertia sinuspersici]